MTIVHHLLQPVLDKWWWIYRLKTLLKERLGNSTEMIIQEGYWKIITLISFEHGRKVGDSVGVSYVLVSLVTVQYPSDIFEKLASTIRKFKKKFWRLIYRRSVLVISWYLWSQCITPLTHWDTDHGHMSTLAKYKIYHHL